MAGRFFTFYGGSQGPWRVRSLRAITGEALPPAQRVLVAADGGSATGFGWCLRGITSNERYVEKDEHRELVARQQGLGRADSTFAALIPIRKTAEWWALSQDERREVFEEQSKHIQVGLRYLPAIARRLHHCRDVSASEPFDFLTWFEYPPSSEPAFEELLTELRASAEWRYVDREVDIRLLKAEG